LSQRASEAYRSGSDMSDALDACRRLGSAGFATTICYWHPKTRQPLRVAEEYVAALDRLDPQIDYRISLRPAGLAFDRGLFGSLHDSIRTAGRRLHLDATALDLADEVFGLIGSATGAPALGTTLPGRWRRSIQDADRVADLGLAARVVKGQYPDPENPGIDPGRGVLEVIDRLAARRVFTSVATHDGQLLREAIRRLRAAGAPCEAELLFGLPMARPIATAKACGAPVRIYVPYGDSAPPYSGSHLLRRPTIAWWLLQDLVRGPNKTWAGLRQGARDPVDQIGEHRVGRAT
jgi:proline dehydrogenase